MTLLAATPLEAQLEPAGTWRVEGVSNITRRAYAGDVTIVPNGNCYAVAWSLESGDRYRGVGMLVELRGEVGEVFVAAWGGEGSYGVVFYEGLSILGIEWFGSWCQSDGRMGEEYLGAPSDLGGAHPLR